jgi:hypothetical protein
MSNIGSSNGYSPNQVGGQSNHPQGTGQGSNAQPGILGQRTVAHAPPGGLGLQALNNDRPALSFSTGNYTYAPQFNTVAVIPVDAGTRPLLNLALDPNPYPPRASVAPASMAPHRHGQFFDPYHSQMADASRAPQPPGFARPSGPLAFSANAPSSSSSQQPWHLAPQQQAPVASSVSPYPQTYLPMAAASQASQPQGLALPGASPAFPANASSSSLGQQAFSQLAPPQQAPAFSSFSPYPLNPYFPMAAASQAPQPQGFALPGASPAFPANAFSSSSSQRAFSQLALPQQAPVFGSAPPRYPASEFSLHPNLPPAASQTQVSGLLSRPPFLMPYNPYSGPASQTNASLGALAPQQPASRSTGASSLPIARQDPSSRGAQTVLPASMPEGTPATAAPGASLSRGWNAQGSTPAPGSAPPVSSSRYYSTNARPLHTSAGNSAAPRVEGRAANARGGVREFAAFDVRCSLSTDVGKNRGAGLHEMIQSLKTAKSSNSPGVSQLIDEYIQQLQQALDQDLENYFSPYVIARILELEGANVQFLEAMKTFSRRNNARGDVDEIFGIREGEIKSRCIDKIFKKEERGEDLNIDTFMKQFFGDFYGFLKETTDGLVIQKETGGYVEIRKISPQGWIFLADSMNAGSSYQRPCWLTHGGFP